MKKEKIKKNNDKFEFEKIIKNSKELENGDYYRNEDNKSKIKQIKSKKTNISNSIEIHSLELVSQ